MTNIRNLIFAAFFVSALTYQGTVLVSQEARAEDSSPAAGTASAKAIDASPLKEEFTRQAKQYEQLFAKRDAAALADMWTTDGSLETFDGTVCHGKEEISAYFKKNFAAYGAQKLNVKLSSLQEASKGVVIEEGTTSIGDATLPTSKYTALHIKSDDGWKMAWVSESTIDTTSIDSVKELSWLSGKWKAATKSGADVTVQAKWIENGNFLECTTVDADRKIEAKQIIGYNPALDTLVSWYFAPNGAIGRGTWSRTSNGWRQESRGLMPNGITSSAIYTIKQRSKDSFTWQSTERTIGGVSIPDSAILVLNRVGD